MSIIAEQSPLSTLVWEQSRFITDGEGASDEEIDLIVGENAAAADVEEEEFKQDGLEEEEVKLSRRDGNEFPKAEGRIASEGFNFFGVKDRYWLNVDWEFVEAVDGSNAFLNRERDTPNNLTLIGSRGSRREQTRR